jgi:uncharacterized membrane protein YfcA
MSIIFYLLIGLLSGVLAGMGMGGGTILIPALTILMGVSQHFSQSINLVSFVPMAIIAIIIHFKNHLINYKIVLPVLALALVGAFFGATLANDVSADLLKTIFGVFLVVIGVFNLYKSIKLEKSND